MEQFFFTFAAALVGASVASVFMASRRRNVGAALIEVIALAFAFASPELIFLQWPELQHGWQRILTTVVLVLLIYSPASWWASRIRDRRTIAV